MTIRARSDVPSLRRGRAFAAVARALSRASRSWFRLLHFSVQTNDVHLIVEADSHRDLARGMQGLAVRCARAVNRATGRRGAVWEHRFHAHALRTPREMRLALVYVLLNFRKHLDAPAGIDPCSSGPWFDGWSCPPPRSPLRQPSPVVAATTWLATSGWRRCGPSIDPKEMPAGGKLRA